jgi:hypothetical protein
VDTFGFLDGVDVNDVGMVESGESLGLALEAGQPVGVRGEVGRQDLERHLAVQGRIPGPIHLSHATRPELVEDLVALESPTDHGDSSLWNPLSPILPVVERSAGPAPLQGSRQ